MKLKEIQPLLSSVKLSAPSRFFFFIWVLDVSGFFVIFKLGGDIYGKTRLKKCVPYFVKTDVFKIAGRTSNFKTCILAFSKMQFQVKSQCQTHVYSRFCLKTHICPAKSQGQTHPKKISLHSNSLSLQNEKNSYIVSKTNKIK